MAKMGSISGTVSDSIGSPVANATITVTANGFSAGAVTNAGGAYQTIGIPAGTYSASATAAGYVSRRTSNGPVGIHHAGSPPHVAANRVRRATYNSCLAR